MHKEAEERKTQRKQPFIAATVVPHDITIISDMKIKQQLCSSVKRCLLSC